MYDPLLISEYIVTKSKSRRIPLNNRQLQLILYNIQLKFLRKGDLAFEDDFEAWEIGPVIPNVYRRFLGFGSLNLILNYTKNFSDLISFKDRKEIDETLKYFHSTGFLKPSTWMEVYKSGEGLYNIIPKEMLKESI